MSDPENQNEIPVDVTANTSSTGGLDVLKKFGLGLTKKAFEAVNASPAPKVPTQAVIDLPLLPESQQVGYRAGVAKTITCCTLGAHLIEKNTAYDFLLMSNAAAKNGITLKINSAFRSMEEQTRLYNERKNPAVAKEKGVAALPGTSNHQSGIALDIAVGMKKSDYIAGRFSATYLWLEKYAAEFGFDHAEGAKVNEPWHWTHLPTTIVGKLAFQAATGIAVTTVDTAINAAASDQSGTQRLTNLEAHDDTVCLARAADASQCSRQTMMKERAVFSAHISNYVKGRVGQLEASKLLLEEQPKAFEPDTINPLVYNFTTGTWGDKKTV